MSVTKHLKQPTRTVARKTSLHTSEPCTDHPYLVLLPMGFTMPLLLPVTRCALTAPFHPYPKIRAVYFLWHFPEGRPRRPLTGIVFPWSPDFPPLIRWISGDHPAICLLVTKGGCRSSQATSFSEQRINDRLCLWISDTIYPASTPVPLKCANNIFKLGVINPVCRYPVTNFL